MISTYKSLRSDIHNKKVDYTKSYGFGELDSQKFKKNILTAECTSPVDHLSFEVPIRTAPNSTTFLGMVMIYCILCPYSYDMRTSQDFHKLIFLNC